MIHPRLLTVAALTLAVLLSSQSAPGQIVPVPGTGCLGPPYGPAGPPLVVLGGPPKPGAVLTVRCPPPPCCLPGTPSVVVLGTCVAPPLPLPPGLGCFPPCLLGCPPVVTVPGPGLPALTIPATAPVGATFCIQCACVGITAIGLTCICLSEKVNVTIVPLGC